MWDIDQMKPLSATVVLSFFIHSELSPFYGIIREDDKILLLSFDQYPTSLFMVYIIFRWSRPGGSGFTTIP